jgi:hypothetical protein
VDPEVHITPALGPSGMDHERTDQTRPRTCPTSSPAADKAAPGRQKPPSLTPSQSTRNGPSTPKMSHMGVGCTRRGKAGDNMASPWDVPPLNLRPSTAQTGSRAAVDVPVNRPSTAGPRMNEPRVEDKCSSPPASDVSEGPLQDKSPRRARRTSCHIQKQSCTYAVA